MSPPSDKKLSTIASLRIIQLSSGIERMPRLLMWSDLDRPLKVSALSGIFWGGVGLTYVTYAMLSGNLHFFLEGTHGWLSLFIALSLFPIWLAFLSAFGLIAANICVLLLYPLFLVFGGLSLLSLSMQRERRGILGFMVFWHTDVQKLRK